MTVPGERSRSAWARATDTRLTRLPLLSRHTGVYGDTAFDRGDVLRYAFGKGFCWFLRCAVTLHPSMHTVRRFPETFLVYGVVGDDWQHFFYALFRYSSSTENSIFCKVTLKCCYCQVALRAVGCRRGWKICSSLLLLFLVRTSERGATRNAFCGATAFPGALFP